MQKENLRRLPVTRLPIENLPGVHFYCAMLCARVHHWLLGYESLSRLNRRADVVKAVCAFPENGDRR
jgi:hypothetical protein